MVLLVFPYFLSGRTAYEAERNICYELEGVIKRGVLSQAVGVVLSGLWFC